MIEAVISLIYLIFWFVILFVLLPRMLLAENNFWESIWSGIIISIFFYMIIGVFLYLLNIFELISLIGVLLVTIFVFKKHQHSEGTGAFYARASALLYDYLDGKFKVKDLISETNKEKLGALKHLLLKWFSSYENLALSIYFFIIFSVSLVLRFKYSVLNLSPPAGTENTLLLSVKHVIENELQKEVLEEQGVPFLLAIIQKIGNIDSLWLINFAGPMIGVATMLSAYFFVCRTTENKLAALITMTLYGVMGSFLFSELWEKQGLIASDECALMASLLAFYFLFRWIQLKDSRHLYTALTGFLIAALTDLSLYIHIFLGILLLIIILSIKKGNFIRSVTTNIWFNILFSILLLVLFVMGFLYGNLEVSDSYGQLENQPFLWLAAGTFLLVLTISLWKLRSSDRYIMPCFVSLWGWILIVLYFLKGYEHFYLLWTLLWSVSAGYLWDWGYRLIEKSAVRKRFEVAVMGGFLTFLFILVPLEPTQPEYAYSNAEIQGYLHIKREHRPKTWMLVSNEDFYPIVYGVGYHLSVYEFITQYDPAKKALTKYGAEQTDTEIPLDIYVYFDPRQAWSQQLNEWISAFTRSQGTLNVFYQRDKLIVYHIKRQQTEEEIFEKIWGKE